MKWSAEFEAKYVQKLSRHRQLIQRLSMHVATAIKGQLIDNVKNTNPDRLRSATSVEDRKDLISKNLEFFSLNTLI